MAQNLENAETFRKGNPYLTIDCHFPDLYLFCFLQNRLSHTRVCILFFCLNVTALHFPRLTVFKRMTGKASDALSWRCTVVDLTIHLFLDILFPILPK